MRELENVLENRYLFAINKQKNDNIERSCQESEVYEEVLSLNGKHILELGCGKADITRTIASTGENRTLVAMEVDKIQHQKNLKINDLSNVQFILAGAEKIPEDNDTFDIVFMFKSLHHIPINLMDTALKEIHRVLKPDGIAYISEPIFEGDFNEVLRLFHDEQSVRETAFNTLQHAVEEGTFDLIEQLFFNTPKSFLNFEAFENNVIKVTHTDHELTNELQEKVKQQFLLNMTSEGAHFSVPIRVDLLRKGK